VDVIFATSDLSNGIKPNVMKLSARQGAECHVPAWKSISSLRVSEDSPVRLPTPELANASGKSRGQHPLFLRLYIPLQLHSEF
jgi:hypothetical protein